MGDVVLESPFEPEWLAGDKINELEFCKAFLEQHPMICIHGTFFTTDGRVTDENKMRRKFQRIFCESMNAEDTVYDRNSHLGEE